MAEHRFDLREGECAALIRLAVMRPIRFEYGTGRSVLIWSDGQDPWPLQEIERMRSPATPSGEQPQ